VEKSALRSGARRAAMFVESAGVTADPQLTAASGRPAPGWRTSSPNEAYHPLGDVRCNFAYLGVTAKECRMSCPLEERCRRPLMPARTSN